MDKESLIKARDFLLNIDNIDIPAVDKIEIMNTIRLLLDPENYDKHLKVLQKEFNEELRWKNK